MTTPEIRPATEADLPFVTEIYEHAVRYGTATFELIPPDLAEMTRRFRALVDGGFPYFVASVEGRVIGYAYAGPYRPRPPSYVPSGILSDLQHAHHPHAG